jgi:hypothetical protein
MDAGLIVVGLIWVASLLMTGRLAWRQGWIKGYREASQEWHDHNASLRKAGL